MVGTEKRIKGRQDLGDPAHLSKIFEVNDCYTVDNFSIWKLQLLREPSAEDAGWVKR